MESITCNRCKEVTSLKELVTPDGALPKLGECTWALISLRSDAWAYWDSGTRASKRHLCPKCLAELETFMLGGAVGLAPQNLTFKVFPGTNSVLVPPCPPGSGSTVFVPKTERGDQQP